jgi:hypothetical protein
VRAFFISDVARDLATTTTTRDWKGTATTRKFLEGAATASRDFQVANTRDFKRGAVLRDFKRASARDNKGTRTRDVTQETSKGPKRLLRGQHRLGDITGRLDGVYHGWCCAVWPHGEKLGKCKRPS